MSSPYKVQAVLTCPRCKVVLPLNETACYSCGYRLTPSASSIPATGSVKTPALSQAGNHPGQRPTKRASLTYFLIILFVIVLFSYVGIRQTGFSLSSLSRPVQVAKPPLLGESFPAPQGAPLFADKFTDDTSGWNLQSVPGTYTVNLSSGILALENDKQKLSWEPLPGVRKYSNFALSADDTLTKGDENNGYGFYIRGAAGQGNELASYYRFELYGDGSYAIFKGSTDANGKSIDTKLVNFLLCPAIAKRGETNHVLIVARGSKLSFIVNNQLLNTVTDKSYTIGTIALFISNLPEAKPGAQVQFSQLSIYAIR